MSQSLFPEIDLSRNGSAPHAKVEAHDSDWLRSLEFRRSTPQTLRRSASEGDVEKFSSQLRKLLIQAAPSGGRQRRKLLRTLADVWCSQDAESNESPEGGSLAQCLFDRELEAEELSGRIETLLAASTPGEAEREMLLAAGWLLRTRSNSMEASTVFDLWRWLSEELTARNSHSRSVPEDEFAKLEDLELALWGAGGCFFHPGAVSQLKEISTAISSELFAAVEKDGSPHSRWLPRLPQLLATLARLRLTAELDGADAWSAKAERRFERLLLKSALFITPGRVLFSGHDSHMGARILQAVADNVTDSSDSLARLLKVSLRGEGTQEKSRKEKKLPASSQQSDEAGWAVLRPTWSGAPNLCAVRVSPSGMELELVTGGVSLIRGAWEAVLTRGGTTVANGTNWSCTCWFTDKDSEYAEYQRTMADGSRVIRHLLLPTRDEFLLVAESIRSEVADPGMELSRECQLSPGWQAQQDSTTREWALTGHKQRIRILPISSPQFRVDRAYETLTCSSEGIAVRSHSAGAKLFSAVVFDWSPERRKAGVDWNVLTVAEDGRQATPPEAVGFRWRIGEDQWILSHSFVPPKMPRTIMGLHTLSETVVSRVNDKGEFEALVEVEAAEEGGS